MPVKVFKPTSPGRRDMTGFSFEEITRTEPERSLVRGLRKQAGRNMRGKITVRHQGGGHKRRYREIDFKRDKAGVPAKVAAIEYDPNRSARIALLHYVDGEKRYIIAPVGLKVGQTVMSGANAEPLPGNSLPLANIPVGLEIHNVELRLGRGGQLCRTAGGWAQLQAKAGDYAIVMLPSAELRKVHVNCRATIGRIGNLDWQNVSYGKAGRKRHLGIRPSVRGTAQNPVDHPMGGGEGRTAGGRHPCSPSGVLAKGGKTRKPNHITDRFILRRRKKGSH